MLPRRPRVRAEDLPEAHKIVLLVLARLSGRRKRGVPFEEIARAVAPFGISEHELRFVLTGETARVELGEGPR